MIFAEPEEPASSARPGGITKFFKYNDDSSELLSQKLQSQDQSKEE